MVVVRRRLRQIPGEKANGWTIIRARYKHGHVCLRRRCGHAHGASGPPNPIGFRAEVRDFYSGSSNYNQPVRGSLQNNAVFTGGLLIKF